MLCEEAKRATPNQEYYQTNTTQTIKSLLKIRNQILAIRSAGKYNMFDTPAVQREAYEAGFYDLVYFIEEHMTDYTHFIFTGDLQNLTLFLYPIPGTRVILDEMPHDLNPVPISTVGTVEWNDDECDIIMAWSNGRNLKLIPSVDKFFNFTIHCLSSIFWNKYNMIRVIIFWM